MAAQFPVELQSVRFRQSLSLWERWHCVSNDGEGEPAAGRVFFVPNSTFWGENRKRLSKMHKKAAQSLAGTLLTVPRRMFLRNNRSN